MGSCDVLVLGAGLSGGLPAAAYLQKAGLDVLLLEQGHACGPFFRSYHRHGVLFDHSPVNFSVMSPAVGDLDLEAFGYDIRPPERLFATLDGTGRVAAFSPDPAETEASLAQLDAADAATFRRVQERLGQVAADLLRAAVFTPFPDWPRALELSAHVLDLDPDDLTGLSGVDLMEQLFDDEGVRISLAALPSLQLVGDVASPRHGALAWLWTYLLRSCVAPNGNGALVDSLRRAFEFHGGRVLLNTPVEEIGRTHVVAAGERFDARVILSNLGAPLTLRLSGETPSRPWSTTRRTVATADVVLRGPLEWSDERLRDAPRVYLLWDSWEHYRRWLCSDDLETYFGHLELAQLHTSYGHGPEGRVGLRVRLASGPWIDGAWEDRRGVLNQRIRERLSMIDATVEDRIVSLDVATPRDHWLANPAATSGNPVGGDFVDGQWLGGRFGYRHREGLYWSNAVWPPALSWMAAGYNAACAIADDLGVDAPRWWTRFPP